MCHWLRCFQYVAEDAKDVHAKLHKDADVKEFRNDPSFDNYMKAAQRQYKETSKVVTDTPLKNSQDKSLRQLLAEQALSSRVVRKILNSPESSVEDEIEDENNHGQDFGEEDRIPSYQPPRKKSRQQIEEEEECEKIPETRECTLSHSQKKKHIKNKTKSKLSDSESSEDGENEDGQENDSQEQNIPSFQPPRKKSKQQIAAEEQGIIPETQDITPSSQKKKQKKHKKKSKSAHSE